MLDYSTMSDIALIDKVKSGDDLAFCALLIRHSSTLQILARRYKFPTYEFSDVIQECNIAFFQAIKSYNADKNNNFVAYVRIVVGSHLINVLKRLTRKKNHTSAQFLSLDYYKEVTLSLVSSPSAESIVFRNEQDIITKNVLKETLSSFEHEVMLYYLNDYSVSEILKRTNRSLKSIDNALTRSKVKLRKRLLNQGAFN